MGRCKDCKWWEPQRYSNLEFNWGRCRELEKLNRVQSPNNDFVSPAHSVPPELLVGANFGCIHFGRKTSLEDSIEELGLSVLPLRALKNSGIKKIDDLVGRTPRELLVIRKFGEKSLQKIESQLQEYNLVERRDVDGCIHFERRGK